MIAFGYNMEYDRIIVMIAFGYNMYDKIIVMTG